MSVVAREVYDSFQWERFWLLHLIGGDVSLFRTRHSPYSLPNAGLRLEREHPGATHEVWLSGRIDIESASDMGKLLQDKLQLPACRTLTVNSEGVVYIDVAGIATLLEVLKAARLLGKQFVLKGLRERPRYLFEVTRLLHLFDGEGESAANMGPVPARTP
jgi:anti-anti-sigma factor